MVDVVDEEVEGGEGKVEMMGEFEVGEVVGIEVEFYQLWEGGEVVGLFLEMGGGGVGVVGEVLVEVGVGLVEMMDVIDEGWIVGGLMEGVDFLEEGGG